MLSRPTPQLAADIEEEIAYPKAADPLAPGFGDVIIPPDFVMHEDGEWYFFWSGICEGDPHFVEKVPEQYQSKLNTIFGDRQKA